MSTHWADYATRWARLGPPLRPDADVVVALRTALSAHPGPTLLLGVTPELADIAADVTAVDLSEGMIRGVWPGDSERRRAVHANWLALPFEPDTFAAAAGDGSLNALTYPAGHLGLFSELARVVRRGGRAALRVFCRPATAESLAAVLDDACARRCASFHAFKWRWCMALCASRESANLSVADAHAAFVAAVPDRARFCEVTGWDAADVDTIDVYRGSPDVYSFPTKDELLVGVPGAFTASLVEAGSYVLAERCPVLVLDRKA